MHFQENIPQLCESYVYASCLGQVIESANGVEFGLCAVVWSRDVSRIHRVARKLKVGSYFAHTGKN